MLKFMGHREVQDGAFGFRTMLSAAPLMGKNGHPELFQTGETAGGVHPLIDRQHPHNRLMEAAGTYFLNLSGRSAGFAYAGIAGEPALGGTSDRVSAFASDCGSNWISGSSSGVVSPGGPDLARSFRARVKRDGNWTNTAARELVPGDVTRLRLGDIVPADARLLEGDPVQVVNRR
jgi:hypothetical protein